MIPACGRGEAPAEGLPRTFTERSPRTFTITEGETVTYQKGVARAGDKIVCRTRVGRIGAAVGKPESGVTGFADGPRGAARIDVVTHDDGSVAASCSGTA